MTLKQQFLLVIYDMPGKPFAVHQSRPNLLHLGPAAKDQLSSSPWLARHASHGLLEFEQSEARQADPLMGWTGSGDTQAQVSLNFPTKEAAKEYAAKYGISARVYATPPKSLKLQAYADNFR